MRLPSRLLRHGQKLLDDPRVAKLLDDERVVKALTQAVSLQGVVRERWEAAAQELARRLHLATEQEVAELRRTIRRLERELERERTRGPGAPTN